MSSSGFVVTAAGLQYANLASNGGPRIVLASFKVGDAYNYAPDANTDTDIRGNTLYSGALTSITQYDTATIDALISLPASVGPFSFGEVGIYTDTGVLFALMSYTTLQSKLQAVTSGVANPWSIHALLQLAQGTGVFFLNNSNAPSIPEFPDFSYVTAPSLMDGSPNAALVHDVTADGAAVLLVRNNDTEWAPEGWVPLLTFSPPTASSSSITGAVFSDLDGNTPGRYLLGDANGHFVPIQTITGNVATLERTSTWVSTGGDYTVYESVSTRAGARAMSIADATSLVTPLGRVWGPPTGSGATSVVLTGYSPSDLPYYGYGQLAIPAIADIEDPTQWLPFIGALQRSASLLDLPVPVPLTDFAAFWPNPILGMAQYSALNDLVSQITRKRFDVPMYKTETSTVITRALSTVNKNRQHYDITATFDTSAEMYSFFNSGGYIGFLLEDGVTNTSTQTYSQLVMKNLFSQLGLIKFGGTSCESVGQLNVRGIGNFTLSSYGTNYKTQRNTGTAYTADAALGFYGLAPSTRTLVFSFMQPIGTDGSSDSTAQMCEVEIYATLSGLTITFECYVSQLSFADYTSGTWTTTVPRQTTVTIVRGRPNSSIITISYPTVITAGSTSW